MDILFTLGSFAVALAILISVHEFGHFWVARRLGVKVLRFSIGFGKPLFTWQRHPDDTEFVIALFPLGGYVKMLDEREEEVPEEQLGHAFNRQPVWKRSAIIAAGPLFNLAFAILAYWGIFMAGDTGLKPVVGSVSPDSVAAESGFRVGDEFLSIGERPARSWETAIFAMTAEAMGGEDLHLRVRDDAGALRDRWIPASAVAGLLEEPDMLGRLGLQPRRPPLPPVIGEVVSGEPADLAGLKPGERVLTADGRTIDAWQDLVAMVRDRPGKALTLGVQGLDRSTREITVVPRSTDADGKTVGRIGAGVGTPSEEPGEEYLVQVRYGPIEALDQATVKTYEMSQLMLRVMGRMLTGEASVRNLSGPITIAEAAGRTASYGLDSFVKFLAVVSISLGVLNLLPIPVLDGGHLLFLLVEWVKGSPVSEQAQIQGQKVGILLLATLMTLAFYADLLRLLG